MVHERVLCAGALLCTASTVVLGAGVPVVGVDARRIGVPLSAGAGSLVTVAGVVAGGTGGGLTGCTLSDGADNSGTVAGMALASGDGVCCACPFIDGLVLVVASDESLCVPRTLGSV